MALNRSKRNLLFAILLLLPALLLLCLTIVAPLAKAIISSFREDSLLSTNHAWNNFANYKAVLGSGEFMHSLGVTLNYVGVVLIVEILVGFGIALLLNQSIIFRPFFRSIIMISWAVPTIVAALVFMWMFQNDFGVVNYLLMKTGSISDKVNWLNHMDLALYAVMVVAIWRQTPLVVTMLLAGMQGIPSSLYEAANIDGAGRIQSLIHITIPQLKPILLNVALITIVNNFQMLTLFFTLTNGGPVDTTETLAVLAYSNAFEKFDMGRGAAIGVMWMIILVGISLFFNRLSRTDGE
ncbi:carbohydrate ABC transporter permease [Paenibacillus antarcticus]|uniref:ABC transmembrane type-1 domain-containing protein n=1 Tax=Paenibacillus antarcticus TaxID=253703 RepID=A0A168P6I3_9BACL|nr:sugar ABC transporter permease [Paenibacillus antarcticus]OAB46437.1 hypothetical protein PBAT_10455 [Paenibacillus antarcticus]